MTVEKVNLGRHLFFDESLSVSGDISCGSCHLPSMAFTDGEARSRGADGERGVRSSMSLANVAYMPTLTWGNPVLESLEDQALVPLFVDQPLEMGTHFVLDEALQRFSNDEYYRALFDAAFVGSESSISVANIAAALASFERSLISAGSPYDHYRAGEDDALDAGAKRGMVLFSDLGCVDCHSGPLQTASFRSVEEPEGISRFENTGLYNLGSDGAYPLPNKGLSEFSQVSEDLGKHRIPSLRNIAFTAPYMHDGSLESLDDVISHYASGGRTLSAGPYVGVGADNPNKSPKLTGFEISAKQRLDLIAFLHALSDDEFIADRRHQDPWMR